MSRRNIQRIDYKEFHSTGQIAEQLSNVTLEDSTMSQPDDVVIDIMILIEEVKDMNDENPIQVCNTSQELDSFVTRLEHQRNAIRRKSHELKPSDNADVLQLSISNTI